jgi:hypothetical protein
VMGDSNVIQARQFVWLQANHWTFKLMVLACKFNCIPCKYLCIREAESLTSWLHNHVQRCIHVGMDLCNLKFKVMYVHIDAAASLWGNLMLQMWCSSCWPSLQSSFASGIRKILTADTSWSILSRSSSPESEPNNISSNLLPYESWPPPETKAVETIARITRTRKQLNSTTSSSNYWRGQ